MMKENWYFNFTIMNNSYRLKAIKLKTWKLIGKIAWQDKELCILCIFYVKCHQKILRKI